jgi:hypothetical protein
VCVRACVRVGVCNALRGWFPVFVQVCVLVRTCEYVCVAHTCVCVHRQRHRPKTIDTDTHRDAGRHAHTHMGTSAGRSVLAPATAALSVGVAPATAALSVGLFSIFFSLSLTPLGPPIEYVWKV